jgi:carbonic anhydrase
MSVDILVERNSVRAPSLRATSRSLSPSLRTVVIACSDHRTDPAHVLGLEPGEAVVLRNPGGRVTSDVLRSLLVLAAVAAIEELGSGFDIVVVHHTDCGLSRLTGPDYASLVADYVGVTTEEVAGLALADPFTAVRHDVDRLRAVLPSPGTTVTGLVHDLESGTVTRVDDCADIAVTITP